MLRIIHAINNVHQNQHQPQTMAQKVVQGAQVVPGEGWGCVTDPGVIAGRETSQMSFAVTSACGAQHWGFSVGWWEKQSKMESDQCIISLERSKS